MLISFVRPVLLPNMRMCCKQKHLLKAKPFVWFQAFPKILSTYGKLSFPKVNENLAVPNSVLC